MEDGKCVGSFLRFQVLKDTIKVKSEIVLGLIINKITSNLSLICQLIVQLMMYLTTTTFMNLNLKRTKKN
jgi:hypothetical protein